MAAPSSSSAMMRVNKSPADRYSYMNCVVISSSNTRFKDAKHLLVNGKPLKVEEHVGRGLAPDEIGLSGKQRTWLKAELAQSVEVKKCKVEQYIAKMTVELDFFGGRQPKKVPPPLNTDKLMEGFQVEFTPSTIFSVGQELVVQLSRHLEKCPVMEGCVLSIELMSEGTEGKSAAIPVKHGLIVSNTIVLFEKREGSTLEFVGSKKGKMLAAQTAIINPDWNFKEMGIGGLHQEFNDIFRRAFASRVFPPELIEKLGMKHVRGILLFGPPGTGKTLMARQIGKMLHAREPKIINGPEILNKYVGESEANIRQLFAEAEKEEKERGINSALHLIIFDEIDAICRARGSLSGSTGVHDTVVNQLLAKMDGVEQLNNILLIGMTNRKDMIDEALLRPGRLEVQMEIGLPDRNGRCEILHIHTAKMREHKTLAEDVDIEELAQATRNFSGAEIEGLVRSAQSTAMNRIIAPGEKKIEVSAEDAAKLRVSKADFDNALLHDVKPAYGVSEEEFDRYIRSGIIEWGKPVQEILDRGKLAVKQAEESALNNLTSLLLKGPPGSGKTALAVEMAKESKFPFVKVISLEKMVGFQESAKSQAIKKVFDDAHKSPVSCVIIDAIERLLDYVVIGPRFSNLVLQTLLVLVNKNPPPGHQLLILGTTSLPDHVLLDMELSHVFQFSVTVPYLTQGEHVVKVLKEANIFLPSQLQEITKKIAGKRVNVGVKKLLAMANSSSLSENEVAHFMEQLHHEASLP